MTPPRPSTRSRRFAPPRASFVLTTSSHDGAIELGARRLVYSWTTVVATHRATGERTLLAPEQPDAPSLAAAYAFARDDATLVARRRPLGVVGSACAYFEVVETCATLPVGDGVVRSTAVRAQAVTADAATGTPLRLSDVLDEHARRRVLARVARAVDARSAAAQAAQLLVDANDAASFALERDPARGAALVLRVGVPVSRVRRDGDELVATATVQLVAVSVRAGDLRGVLDGRGELARRRPRCDAKAWPVSSRSRAG